MHNRSYLPESLLLDSISSFKISYSGDWPGYNCSGSNEMFIWLDDEHSLMKFHEVQFS